MKILTTMDDLDTKLTIEEFRKTLIDIASWKHLAVTAYRQTCFVNASVVYYLSYITF